MVQGSAQIRRQGAQDFMAYYNFSCARQESVPLPSVKMNVDKGMLDFNGDRLKLADWPPVLTSIAINKHLHRIAITSTFQACPGDAERRYYKAGFRKKIPVVRSKDMTFKLCKALRECLTVSPNLKTLQLNGLPLRERDLIVLTKGLAKNASLQNLSLVNCPISDEGLEVICQSVKYSPSIRTVDFTGCNLTWRGAEHMANIIKHQGMQRHGTAWAESLRYRHPHFEAMGGLRRVTLNSNTLIGDCGAAALAQELTEDLWVKAVDLQRCGLSNEGARRLLEALKTNSALCVLDVRGNPLVDKALIKTIIEKALMNSEADGQSLEYAWIKPAATEPQRASGAKKPSKPRPIRGKTTFRIAACKSTSGGRSSGVAPVQKLGSRCGYIPWRSAARAGRQRGLPPGVTVTDQIFEGAATVTVNVDSGSEEEEEEEEVTVEVEQRLSSLNLQDRVTGRQLDHFQMELRECRLRLAEERRARLKAESRVMEYELENARLRDANRTLTESLAATGSGLAPPGVVSVLEDEAVLESIESSFNKFHAFLDLLKDAGLGQLASMAGIHKSDFQPLGKPQLSSTVGKHLDVEDFPTNPDALPLVTTAAPARPGGPGETTTLRSLSSVREPLLEDRLLDVTFKKASGLAVERGIGGEKEPNQYSKPYTEHESGSEYSSYSQRSLDKVSFGGTFQIQQNKHRSGSNSHWSDPHHRSYSSHSHGSNAGLSGRSSISDTISDEMESVGSDESRNSRKGKRGAKVLSGSEGRAYPAREVMEQMRSWGDPGWRDPGWQESF